MKGFNQLNDLKVLFKWRELNVHRRGAWMLLAFWREKDRFSDVMLLLFLIGAGGCNPQL